MHEQSQERPQVREKNDGDRRGYLDFDGPVEKLPRELVRGGHGLVIVAIKDGVLAAICRLLWNVAGT